MAIPPRKQEVSLRGASAKEITRDALLEKVSHERELRNYTRRAAAAVLSIQKVWRRYYVRQKVARQLQEEWEILMIHHNVLMGSRWVSCNLLRPFLFFVTCSLASHQKLQIRNIDCMLMCFQIVLKSINSTDTEKNFCSLAVGTSEERSTWFYQARKLVWICSFILAEFDHSFLVNKEKTLLTALAMQLIVALTDPKGWKCFSNLNHSDSVFAVKNLIQFIATGKSGFYSCVRRYIMKLGVPPRSDVQTNDHFLITASAITLALRPFHVMELYINNDCLSDVKDAAEQYCIFLLTVPCLSQCLPAVLLPALKHESVLSPCLKTLLVRLIRTEWGLSNILR